MADKHTLARPYAQAAFDLAGDSGTLDQWSQALEKAAAVAANDDVTSVLNDPHRSEPEQLEILTGLLQRLGESYVFAGNDQRGRNFLRLLIENDRVQVLPEIAERFETLKAEVENTVDVTVTAAAPVSDERIESIKKALGAKLGRKINISTAIDADLIGGAVIRAGDFVIDGSVRSRLAGLQTALAN